MAARKRVLAHVRKTRNGCPYLRVKGTGCEADFVPAPGYGQTGKLLVSYQTHPTSEREFETQIDMAELPLVISRYANTRDLPGSIMEVNENVRAS